MVVVVIIAAAFYVEIPMVSTLHSTSTSASVSTTSSSATGSTTSAPSTGTLSFSTPQPLLVAPDVNYTVTLKLTAIGTVSGNYTFSASGLPTGVTARFNPSTATFPAQLGNPVTMTLSAASGATVANATMNVQATAGSSVYTQPFPVMSVQALVLIQGNAFTPNSLTVATGAKVYWINLDSTNTEAQGGVTGHDVTALDGSFSSGTGNLLQYDVYGHTFTTAGTVAYECKAQLFTGQIVVT
jgi:endoglucanase